MKALIQRVAWAQVTVAGEQLGAIERGILALIGVERDDTEQRACRLLDKLVRYRIFADETGRMNLSLLDMGGDLLLVPQFTLVADTTRGLRPSFSSAATPQQGRELFDYLLAQAGQLPCKLASGRYGADMAITLLNDGPVTFWLES